MIDGAILQEYMSMFYGYGHYGAGTWLVGMEEGGGASADEIAARLRSWTAGGRRELDDVGEFHRRTGMRELYRWFEPGPPIQSTWGKIIKILLHARGLPVSAEAVRRFQSEELGRCAQDCAILELLPLPAPGKAKWPYDKWTDVPQLASRRTYEEAWRVRRAAYILERIRHHVPRLVVFYGGGDRAVWQRVINEHLSPTSSPNLFLARLGRTTCAFTKLPQAISGRDLETVGKTLASHLTVAH